MAEHFQVQDLIPYAILAGGAYLAWQWWQGFGSTGCFPFDVACLAKKAGESVGEEVITPIVRVYETTTKYYYNPIKGTLEGTPTHADVPSGTPSYEVDPGACPDCWYGSEMFGSSGGETPVDFCLANPSAPVCASVDIPWWKRIPVLGDLL